MKNKRFRLGTTSYIIPDDILPNVRFLADKVDDIELVLFEVDDGPNNLPDAQTIRELNFLAETHNLTYTVHLPLDLEFGFDGDKYHVSIEKALKVIRLTEPLNPFAYVVHLNGRDIKDNCDQPTYQQWLTNIIKAITVVSEALPDPNLLSVENLEGYPLDFWDAVFDLTPVSRCIDIGHLILDQIDPIPYLNKHLHQTNVIHLHGINGRDHKSIHHIPRASLTAILQTIHQQGYNGVLTLEIFNEEDFNDSIRTLEELNLINK